MAFFSTNSVLENLYFSAGVLQVVVIVILIIQQVVVNKDRARKEDEIAIKLCKDYVVDLHRSIDKVIAGRGASQEISRDDLKECVHILNQMEVMALFFTKGIANSKIGKDMIGSLYKDHLATLMDIVTSAGWCTQEEFIRNYVGCYNLIKLWK